jgi:hypothetical protein
MAHQLAQLRLLPLVLFAAALALAPAALAVAQEPDGGDDPAAAGEWFILKRSPDGVSPIPVDKYIDALNHMKGMPRHSTATRTLAPPAAIAPSAVLPAWTSLGPGNIGGRTRALVIDPVDPQTMYAAGVAGGVFKTTDGGASWRPTSDLLPNIAVSSLAMDPTNRSVLYAGTGEQWAGDGVRGAGMFKTTDGAATWTRLDATNTPDFYMVNRIVVSPNNPARVYAATINGVWRSLDGGATWQNIRPLPLDGSTCHELVIRTDMPNDYLFAACGVPGSVTVWRATAAATLAPGAWESVLTEPGMSRTTLAIAPSDQTVIYALAAHAAGDVFDGAVHAVFRSSASGDAGSWVAQVRQASGFDPIGRVLLTNSGSALNLPSCTFGDPTFWRNQGTYDNAIAVDPKDPNRVWAGGIDQFRSDDGGRTWGIASFWARIPSDPLYVHADQHLIVFDPRFDGVGNQTMFVTNDGGVFRTQNSRLKVLTCASPFNGSVTWTNLNHGYAVTQFYFGLPYPDGTRYLGGTQDNGTVRGGNSTGPDGWERLLAGDGGWVAIDPRNTSRVYVTQPGWIYRSNNDAQSYFDAKQVGNVFSLAPLIMDPSAPDVLWTGGAQVWRTVDGGDTWTAASAPLINGDLVASIAVAPTDSNRVLIGGYFGRVHRSTSALTADGSTVWASAQVSSQGFVSGVTFDPHDPNVAYATVSTFTFQHVWRSSDGGATWTPIDGTGSTALPDVPVHVILVDPHDSARLYIGTDVGVFVSIDGGATWAVEITGFASVITESLSMATVGGAPNIFAFTHGRGAWRTSLGGTTQPPAISALTPSSAPAGSPDFVLTVSGTGFVAGATVNWNGTSRPTFFSSATSLSASIPAADVARAGLASVTVRNPDAQVSNAVSFTITPCPAGQFFAEYFSNMTLTPPATRTACETAVNNLWGAGGPPGLPVDNFSVRWTGRFNFGGTPATFTARADDGIRVVLDGVAIIDQFHDQPATTYTTTVTPTAATHEVKIEYYEKTGDAVAQVSWTGGTAPPTVTALTPNTATAGGAAFTLTVDGTNFITGSSVLWNGTSRATTFVSGTRLTAAIAAADIAAAGSVPVSVKNPDGQTSNAMTFTVNPPGGGCPVGQFFAQYFGNMTLTPPATRTACESTVNNDWGAGGPAGLPVDNFSVRWTGQFTFGGGSVTFTARADDGIRVVLDGVAIIDQFHDQPATTYTTAVSVPAGTHEVRIEYYEKGGDALAQVSWTGAGPPPPPALTALTPSSATAGGPAFTLTVDGANFNAGATVLWNGSARATTFVSGTRLTAAIAAADIAAAGSVPVSVRNPDGQVSGTLAFTITPAGGGCPTGQFFAQYFSNISLTAPATRSACEPAVNYDFGAGAPAGLPVDNFSARWTGQFTFAGGSVTFTARADDGIRVFLDGTLLIDQFHDQPATTYTATVAVAAGTHEVKIEYYERGGDAVVQVSWTGAPVGPSLTAITPNSATAGGAAFTLTADGSNFGSGATVLWNGAARATTFVSATRLTASIPASDIAAAGSAAVSVRNPDGQTSGTLTFAITPAAGDSIKVFITAPANGATVRGTVWFTVWLENAAAGARTLTLSVNGTTITSTSGTANGPYSIPWATTTADNGSRTATVTVRDSASATGRASITVTVAN